MTEGRLAATLRLYRKNYAHVQAPSVLGRNEPGLGEINYDFLFELLDELGYDGWVGCEYRPLTTTSQGVGWINLHKRINLASQTYFEPESSP